MGGAGTAARARRWACGGPLIALALAAPAVAAPGLVKVGDFDGPTYATGAPGTRRASSWSRSPGACGWCATAPCSRSRSWTCRRPRCRRDEERGLLSAAFAPDYATSGQFYVYLTARPAGEIQIWEYTRSAANPDVADPASGRMLLAIPHPDAANHNGGQVQFGPDGKLWLGTGDGGGGNDQFGHSQDPGSLLGKLIRLDSGRAHAGGRRARAAQPVALLVRPRDRAARDRRRRPGRVRGDRRRARGATTAGRASRARRGGRRRPRPATAGRRRRC